MADHGFAIGYFGMEELMGASAAERPQLYGMLYGGEASAQNGGRKKLPSLELQKNRHDRRDQSK